MEPQEQAPIVQKKLPISTPAAIITGAVIIALALFIVLKPKPPVTTPAQQQPDVPTSVPADVATVRSQDYVRGDINTAQVVIYEYVDTDCFYCQRFHPELQQLMTEYKGKIAWVSRYLPLDIHPNAYAEALALQCVGTLGGNTAYWNYFDKIIDITLSPNPTSNKMLTTLATEQGVDSAQFTSCLKDTATAQRIDADIAEANKIGVRGTPFSVMVNKKGEQVIVPGAYPIEELRKMIDSLL
jgi:protein-disulfide isomerase